MIMSSPWILE